MKIAFIHYHLKPGGVTTVLRQQVEAILDECDSLVLASSIPESSFPCDIVNIPGLGYDRPKQNRISPEDVATSIIKAINTKWKTGCDVVHVHNPTLAKNRNFLKILKVLQNRKIKLLLQIHDFAEDGRPLSYFSDDEYVPDCHYGVINSRDYNILLKAGLKKEGLHKIFNTIKPLNFNSTGVNIKECVLYPIRAIRRKNIGEAILLSLFFKNNETLAITLPPNSPADIKSYIGWKIFVKEKNLNIVFETGITHEFSELLMSSKFIITTSITEGFGFSFLEPWAAKKILWGRKLPDICHDFEKNNIQLDHLYTKLNVPVEWIGRERLYEKWKSCILIKSGIFDLNLDEKTITTSFGKLTSNDLIDFGLLDEAFQKIIISRVLADRTDRDRLISLNPYLSDPGYVSNKEVLIQNNMKAVLLNYNKTIYKEKLIEIYTKVVNSSVRQSIDKEILISCFFKPETFSLLKWGDYAE
jgi:glycosyltransferase involved in cell wall biosynthesis